MGIEKRCRSLPVSSQKPPDLVALGKPKQRRSFRGKVIEFGRKESAVMAVLA
jgi:hypothetical protein